ncbi:MAG TPA: GNAT family N-acetyltransferase [Chitinophagales bacterium]|nr:GNAT family N-acetyltransferase [Chitinophagales bacterium]
MITWQLKPFNALSPTELYNILQLRSEVFVVEQTCPYLDPDGKDFNCHHLMGYVGSDLAAYSRLVEPGISYDEVSIGRVITSPKYRGKEFGKLLMQQSIAEIEKLYGPVPIRIGAQAYLKKFYEGFGFADLDQPYMEDGIPHLIMLRG